MTSVQITVSGLREMQAALRGVDKTLLRELSAAHKLVAEGIVGPARAAMAAQPVPKAAAAAAGIRARAGQRYSAIALLGSNPWVRAVEFGALTHTVFGREMIATAMKRRVFRLWRGNAADAGYAFYPTLRDLVSLPGFLDEYHRALDATYARAFPERI